MVLKSNTERNNSNSYNIKKLKTNNPEDKERPNKHSSIIKSKNDRFYFEKSNNLINFNFKRTNFEMKNFSEYETFIKNDVLNKKTSKKLNNRTFNFNISKNNITGDVSKCINDEKVLCKKKLFVETYNKKTLWNACFDDLKYSEKEMNKTINPCQYNYNSKRGNIEDFHTLKTKKHFSNINPGEETLRLNDKLNLLPTEYQKKHFRGVSAYSSSSLSLRINRDRNLQQSQPKNLFTFYKKTEYPYARDNVKNLLKNEIKYRDQKITQDINRNKFYIFKRVEKI